MRKFTKTDNYRLCECLRILAGLVLLVSGFLKALDSGYFNGILLTYNNFFRILTPTIIFLELMLGLLLIFNIGTRYVSISALIMIVLFTIIFTYGLVFLGIDKCGCFGNLKGFDNPTFLYFRNIIFCVILLFVWRKSDNYSHPISTVQYLTSLLFIFVLGFIVAKTLKNTKTYPEFSIDKRNNYEDIHKIKSLIELSPDTTYLVSFFSYNCPHCINTMGNLVQYKELKIVDKIIGFAMNDTIAEKRFRGIFNPDFEIVNLPKDRFMEITKEFPLSYIVRADTIVYEIKGELPSAYFFHN